MRLADLQDLIVARGLTDAASFVGGRTDVAVTGVAYDSRRVTPGQVFVALRGNSDFERLKLTAPLTKSKRGPLVIMPVTSAQLR